MNIADDIIFRISDKIKRDFFKASFTLWMHRMDTNKTHGEKATWELHKNDTSYFEQILEATLYKTKAKRPITSHL